MFSDLRARFIRTAQELEPTLFERRVSPPAPPSGALHRKLPRNWRFQFDFEEYCVGEVELRLRFFSHPDAPLRLRFKLAETRYELDRDFDSYDGTLGRGWLQDGILVLDNPPETVRLPRRYAFRYLELAVEHHSECSNFSIESVTAITRTSADWTRLTPLAAGSELDRKIDRIGCRTLAACMQRVFEDGPKRDRRLWLGDLRIEAAVNYKTFRNFDLVRRCLYLFAATAAPDGRVPGALFDDPKPTASSQVFDYAALYPDVLLSYLEVTGDESTAAELWPVARRQSELLLDEFDSGGEFRNKGKLWLFFDWKPELHRTTAATGITLFALRRTVELARILGREPEAAFCIPAAKRLKAWAIRNCFDPARGVFLSGPERQFSWASQIWMVLAGALPPEEGRRALMTAIAAPEAVGPGCPYLCNQMVQALRSVGADTEAIRLIREYWGPMAEAGLDTFPEVFPADRPEFSPYGDPVVNSNCHAWSVPPIRV